MINDVQKVYNYFEEILDGEPEKLEALKVLMSVNGDEQGIIDFIDYYGFDVDELNAMIEMWHGSYTLDEFIGR